MTTDADKIEELATWFDDAIYLVGNKDKAEFLHSLSAELSELQQAKESFEWMLKNGFYPKYQNSGIYDRNPIPPYLKSRLEGKK